MAQAREDQQKQPAQAIENDTQLMDPFAESNEQIQTQGKVPPVLGDFGSAGPSASDRAYGGYVRVLASTLNVRSSPTTESKNNIVGKLHRGALVEQVGREGDWVKIAFHGQTAYVHHHYVVAADTRPSKEGQAEVMDMFREVNGEQGRGKPPGPEMQAEIMQMFREVNGEPAAAPATTTAATASTTATAPATTTATTSATDAAKQARIQELANDLE